MESLQHKLDRVRPPRVQITYDVEIGNALQMKELPFVVGILADLSGHPENPLPKLKDRKFVEIDRDNFNDILSACSPRLTLRIPNKINEEGDLLSVTLTMKSMNDFHPVNIIKQVPIMNDLYSSRVRLKDLLTKLDGNEELEEMLEALMKDAPARAALQKELGTPQLSDKEA